MIEQMRDEFSVKDLCEAFEVNRSSYYKWRSAPQGHRAKENAAIVAEIKAVRSDPKLHCYGSPRMSLELKDRGVTCSENRVARLMRCHQIRAKQKRPFRPRTTISSTSAKASPNLLRERPQPTAPSQTLVSDITYVATGEGWSYLAVVMDLHTRMITGWALGEGLESQLVIKALTRKLHEGHRTGVA